MRFFSDLRCVINAEAAKIAEGFLCFCALCVN